MPQIRKRIINGKERYYLESSTRLTGGKIKKISIYLKSYNLRKKSNLRYYQDVLKNKIVAAVTESAADYYKKLWPFNNDLLKRLEGIRLGYKTILKKLNKKQMQDIIDRFTVNFAYESNAIEGNSLTLKDVVIVLQEKKIMKDKDLREIYEILNTRKAMELVFNNKLNINEKDIIKLHRILVENTGIQGGYKNIPNFILGRRLETTPPENVKREMDKLIGWYQKNKQIHPLQMASIFHGRFEHIHPFEDGNGRVGRLLINIILLNNGYPPLIIRKTQRIAYFSSLEAFDYGYEDKLHRFLIEKYKRTYEKFFMVYIKYITDK